MPLGWVTEWLELCGDPRIKRRGVSTEVRGLTDSTNPTAQKGPCETVGKRSLLQPSTWTV
jgi:hypothetical protein